MSSEKSRVYWSKMSESIKNPNETTNKRKDTYLENEVSFLKKHLVENTDIIDIGSGSGLIVNELVDYLNSIIAVETFSGLTQFIDKRILVINAELANFKIRKEFDAIVSTGVTHYFTREDVLKIYKNMYSMLKSGSKLIMRSHCGITKDVIINGFSEELQSDYFTEYRQLDSEVELLKSVGFKSVDVFDEVDDELNVWENTRHYYIVCVK